MKTTLLALILAGATSSLSASIITYAEAPNVQSTHLGGVAVEGFNNLAPGSLAGYTSSIGYYSGGNVMAPDIFGGANNTSYSAVGVESGTPSYVLQFTGPQSFFGLYWQAIDAANSLEFYNGSTLVGTFSGSDILAGLSAAYFGNPNTSTDLTEKFAYIGFLSDSQITDFTSVKFISNNPGMGFESDNHTILAGSPATVAAPEPSTILTMVPVLGGLIAAIRRRARVS